MVGGDSPSSFERRAACHRLVTGRGASLTPLSLACLTSALLARKPTVIHWAGSSHRWTCASRWSKQELLGRIPSPYIDPLASIPTLC